MSTLGGSAGGGTGGEGSRRGGRGGGALDVKDSDASAVKPRVRILSRVEVESLEAGNRGERQGGTRRDGGEMEGGRGGREGGRTDSYGGGSRGGSGDVKNFGVTGYGVRQLAVDNQSFLGKSVSVKG